MEAPYFAGDVSESIDMQEDPADDDDVMSGGGGGGNNAGSGSDVGSQQGDQAAGGEQKRSRICQVCEGPAETFHLNYGASACFSCRAFFRRAIQQKKWDRFVCRGNDNPAAPCAITAKTRRRCQKCRYEKCVSAGMKADCVLNDDGKRNRFKKMFQRHEQQVAKIKRTAAAPVVQQEELAPTLASPWPAKRPRGRAGRKDSDASSNSDHASAVRGRMGPFGVPFMDGNQSRSGNASASPTSSSPPTFAHSAPSPPDSHPNFPDWLQQAMAPPKTMANAHGHQQRRPDFGTASTSQAGSKTFPPPPWESFRRREWGAGPSSTSTSSSQDNQETNRNTAIQHNNFAQAFAAHQGSLPHSSRNFGEYFEQQSRHQQQQHGEQQQQQQQHFKMPYQQPPSTSQHYPTPSSSFPTTTAATFAMMQQRREAVAAAAAAAVAAATSSPGKLMQTRCMETQTEDKTASSGVVAATTSGSKKVKTNDDVVTNIVDPLLEFPQHDLDNEVMYDKLKVLGT